MNDLEQHILEAIRRKPGQLAKEVAAHLGVDRKLVNSALYGPLRGKVQQDKNYRWYPKDTPSAESRDDHEPKQRKRKYRMMKDYRSLKQFSFKAQSGNEFGRRLFDIISL